MRIIKDPNSPGGGIHTASSSEHMNSIFINRISYDSLGHMGASYPGENSFPMIYTSATLVSYKGILYNSVNTRRLLVLMLLSLHYLRRAEITWILDILFRVP